jgi:AcrR family transcriptional regulator
MTGAAISPIFHPPPALPRGPHQLARTEVAHSQRIRLMAAFTELMAERGYAGVRIGELVNRAGVSRATFYEHFEDKQHCLLAAYQHFAAEVMSAITPEIDEHVPWREFVKVTLDAYLAVLQRDLTAARAFTVEMDAAGPIAREHRRAASDAFAKLLAERHAAIRARDRSLGPLPQPAYLALALSARELVRDKLEREQAPDLHQLAPDLMLFATAIVEGAAAAHADQRDGTR